VRFFAAVIEQRVLGNLLYVLLATAGVMALLGMPVEEYPNVSFDQVEVKTLWPGASPEDVERLITAEIEDEIEDVAGIDKVQSTSIAGWSRILVKFQDDISREEFERGYRDLEAEVRKVKDLPPDAERPLVERIEIEGLNPVVTVILFGEAPEHVRKGVADELERRIEAIPGVRRAQVTGVREREVRVEVDPERLRAYGLSLDDVSRALAARNVTAPGGVLKGSGGEVVVRTSGEWRSLAEMLDAPIAPPGAGEGRSGGAAVRLRDLARVEEGFEEERLICRYQGRPCAMLGVIKTTESNALEIRALVDRVVERFREDRLMPEGLEVGFLADTTLRIRDRVLVLVQNVAVGSALVFLILGLFLGFRMSLLAILGVGFAFLGTFVGLKWIGHSVNVLSLFGLVLVSGILVDDAIVVIENYARRRELGDAPREAAVRGAAEIAWPVVSSVLTTVAAFLPLLLMSGVTGKFFAVIPTAVAVALAVSLFEAIAILPIHLVDADRGGPIAPGKKLGALAGATAAAERVYARIIGPAVRHRYRTLAAVLLVFGGAVYTLRWVQVVFFPSDYQLLFVNAKLPPDASLAETDAVLRRADAAVRSLGPRTIESAAQTAGFYYDYNYQPHLNAHVGQLLVTLARDRERGASTREVMARMRERLAREDLGRATVEVTELNDGPPIGRPVCVRLTLEDLPRLRAVAREATDVVASIPGVLDVGLDLETGKREAVARVDEERAAALGVSVADVARAIADANEGRVATSWRRGDTEWDVRVRIAPEARASVADLGEARSRASSGALVSAREVASIGSSSGFAAIRRYQRERTATITGDVDLRVTSSLEATREVERRLRPLLEREAGLAVSFAGEFEETNRSFASLGKAFAIAMIAIFAILGAQFRSYLQPLVVLASVPFALVGVIAGIHLTGDPFTVATGLGVVGLAGVAVNDGIVLIDFANGRRRAGLTAERAIVEAGPLRLRAIFLTSVTTVAGLLPSAVGLGGRSVVWGPMASALCFGMTAQILLTLLVTPALYMVAEDVLSLARRLTGERAKEEEGDRDERARPRDPRPAPRDPDAPAEDEEARQDEHDERERVEVGDERPPPLEVVQVEVVELAEDRARARRLDDHVPARPVEGDRL
jgi:HAE1 family hydrophobic/amphiphilic exporter-1